MTDTTTSSKTTKSDILKANERWLTLMNSQAEVHKTNLDPRLYRQSAKVTFITPPHLKK